MRVKNISTSIVTVDEYIGTGLLQLRLSLDPNQAKFVDDHLAKSSIQLSQLAQQGAIVMVSTSETVTIPIASSGVLTVTPDPDSGYSATVPVRATIVKCVDPVRVEVSNQTPTTFTLTLKDSAGVVYSTADVDVFYTFGTPLQRLT